MNVSQPLVQAGLLGEAIDAGPALVFVADEDMRYVAVNRTACEMLGYSRDELLKLKASDITARAGVEQRFAKIVSNGRGSGRTALRRSDGSTLKVEYRASRVTVAQMTFYVSVSFVLD